MSKCLLENNPRSSLEPVFFIKAKSIDPKISNRWVVFENNNLFDVFLETTKEKKISKAHAASFKSLEPAILFAIRMNLVCSKKKSLTVKKIFNSKTVH